MRALVAAAIGLVAALLVQLTIVNGLPLPGGGAPDLVLLCVVAIGLTGGPDIGVIAGFCAGLALDLAPPASQVVGQYALVFCLVGYGCGRMRNVLRHSALLAMVVAALAAVVGEILAAGVSLVLDGPQAGLSTLAHVLASSILYDIVLTPVVLFAVVRVAVALGARTSVLHDSPALEPGGSAARSARTALPALGYVPVTGAIGWLDGPGRSRRARRKQARLSARVAGASPRRGATWIGREPSGVFPATTQAAFTGLAGGSGLSRLRVGTGVAGSASYASRPTPAAAPRPGLPRIAFGTGGLPGEGRARGRGIPRIAFGGGQAGSARANGQRAPRIGFGTGGLLGEGRAAGRGVPQIAFGSGHAGSALAGSNGSGRAARRAMPGIAFAGGHAGSALNGSSGRSPRIAFGTGGLPGEGRAAGRGVPRIGFGGAGSRAPRSAGPGLAGSGLAPGRPTPQIAFGTGGLTGAGRAAGRGSPRIAFGNGSLISAARTSHGRPAEPRFRSAAARSATGPWLARSARAARGELAFAGAAGYEHALPTRISYGGRRRRHPRFTAASPSSHHGSTARPRTPRLAFGNRSPRWLPHWRRAGGRSTVWRIGGTRVGGYR